MEITCNCGQEGYELAEYYNIETRKANKEHVCCECGGAILPKQRYENASGCWEGSWKTYKTCAVCVAIRKRYCPDGYIYEGLKEALWECLGIDYVTNEIAEWTDDS